MKDLAEYATNINDFQHQIEAKIRAHQADAGFPKMGNLSEDELSDYLFDYQAALDSTGSEQKRYTIAGVLIILPILVTAAFPDDKLPFEHPLWNLLMAVGIGLCIFGLYHLLSLLIVKIRLHNTNKAYPEAKRYVDEVQKF